MRPAFRAEDLSAGLASSIVDEKSNPEYLRATTQAVREFQDAFADFLALHETMTVARGVAPAVVPSDGVDPVELNAARQKVDVASGRASDAPRLTSVFYDVQGVARPVDPIAAWHSVTTPKPVLEPDDILSACGRMIGVLEQMTSRAEALAAPVVEVEALHPLIWGAARGLWNDGHYRSAVATAAETLVTQVKTRVNRNDVPETSLWQETFSDRAPEPGRPRLRWPGDPTHRDVQSMNAGLRQLAPGMQMTIRNAAAHGVGAMSRQEALERLAALSLLARWVEGCDVHTAVPEA